MSSQFIKCPRCATPNMVGANFCQRCGLQFNQPHPQRQAVPPLPKKKNSLLGLWIALGLIGFCAIFGLMLDKTKPNSNSSSFVSNTNSESNANIQTTPTPPMTFAEIKAKSQPLLKMPTQSSSEFTTADVKPFDEVMKPLREIPKNAKEYKEAQALLKQLIDKSSVIAAEIVVLGPKPQNSSWDGNVAPAQNYLKLTLKDYDSSEYLGWTNVSKIYIGKEPYWTTTVRIRAKNSFGAFVVDDITFLIRNNQVVKTQ